MVADAHRRDFTINGMFYDPVAGQTIDHVGGREDIAAGLLRAIGRPQQRFAAAIDAGEKINMLQPEAAGDHRELGNLYFRVGAYQQARSSFHAYLRHAGEAEDDGEVRHTIATIGGRLGALN